jgi:hypothetical protein
MLSRFDDYPIHQMPEPVSHPGATDPEGSEPGRLDEEHRILTTDRRGGGVPAIEVAVRAGVVKMDPWIMGSTSVDLARGGSASGPRAPSA